MDNDIYKGKNFRKVFDFLIGFFLPYILLILLIKLNSGVIGTIIFIISILNLIGLARKYIVIGMLSLIVTFIVIMGYGILTCKGL